MVARAVEQLDLLAVRHLADVLAVAAEVGPNVLVEILSLSRLGALARDLERKPRLERDRHGAVGALVRTHPAEEEQVVAPLGVVGVVGEVERVGHVRDPRQLRLGSRWLRESEISFACGAMRTTCS